MADRWSFQDGTTDKKGYCRILLDGMEVCVDVFPFRKGADPERVKRQSIALVEVLNAADYWRSCPGDGSGPERLEDAVDALHAVSSLGKPAKHTPGPRKVYRASLRPQFPGSKIIEVQDDLANARLIAEAPTLLAALRELVDCISDPVGVSIRQHSLAVKRARAAITRATGSRNEKQPG